MEEILLKLINLIMAVIATEAATNLLTKSEFSIRFIKNPLQKRRNKFFGFINDILDCGYCTSVWMACLFTLFYFSKSFSFIVIVLVLHRLSNIFHFLIDLLDEKRPRDF